MWSCMGYTIYITNISLLFALKLMLQLSDIKHMQEHNDVKYLAYFIKMTLAHE